MAAADPDRIANWLNTPLGSCLLAAEQQQIANLFERVFGVQLIQIGSWGHPDSFLPLSRTQRKALVGLRQAAGSAMIMDPAHLALATDSADVVLLPHTLEFTPSPHALLREVDRILRPDGHLLILAFNPGGPWGIRHLLTPGGFPPGALRLIGEGRLSDWLQLLSFDVDPVGHYCHVPPLNRCGDTAAVPAGAARWLPFLSGGYLIKARKRIHPLTPIRPVWRQPSLKVVGGLVEPTTRSRSNRQAE
jgi:SAM-dependent methyltransferase